MKNTILHIFLFLTFIYQIYVVFFDMPMKETLTSITILDIGCFLIPIYSFSIFYNRKIAIIAYLLKSISLCIVLEIVYYFWLLFLVVVAIGIYGLPTF
jgi:hypothetical protein